MEKAPPKSFKMTQGLNQDIRAINVGLNEYSPWISSVVCMGHRDLRDVRARSFQDYTQSCDRGKDASRVLFVCNYQHLLVAFVFSGSPFSHMASTSSMGPFNISLHRRKSQVFVEIPPSPLFKGRVASTPSKVDDISAFHVSTSHKENAPPLSTKTYNNNIPHENKNKSKRKAQDDEDQVILPGAKKAKVPLAIDGKEIIACHQCRSKKSVNCVSLRTPVVKQNVYVMIISIQLSCNVQVPLRRLEIDARLLTVTPVSGTGLCLYLSDLTWEV